jgi:hypothetical protein
MCWCIDIQCSVWRGVEAGRFQLGDIESEDAVGRFTTKFVRWQLKDRAVSRKSSQYSETKHIQ